MHHADDFTLMPPTGGDTSRDSENSPERIAEMSALLQAAASATLEVVETYASGNLAVLVAVERQHGEVGDYPEQDWSLRVTLVFRREESVLAARAPPRRRARAPDLLRPPGRAGSRRCTRRDGRVGASQTPLPRGGWDAPWSARELPARGPVVGAQQRVGAAVAEDHRAAEEPGERGSSKYVDEDRRSRRAAPAVRPGSGSRSSSGPSSGSAMPSATSGVSMSPGAIALSRMPAADPVVGRRVAAHEPRDRGLRRRIGEDRPACLAELACARLVAGDARVDERLGDPGLAGGGVRADRRRPPRRCPSASSGRSPASSSTEPK